MGIRCSLRKREPPARSVHTLLGLPSREGSDLVAVMFCGEGDPAPKELGHDGAGKFLSDVWGLKWNADGGCGGWSWEKATLKEDGKVPQPRGWFARDISEKGEIVMQGGLNDKNERIGVTKKDTCDTR